ncbi:site-2 protease family protein [Nocardioides rubriscoriae]|uniref:site-2 protease family protein n=1 Tax=Nocardioides rubriscoriae TaxID=642762 RepID=UPI0011E03FFE|nr:site-2 protease family protein [Nocardioides rubriscoriae]
MADTGPGPTSSAAARATGRDTPFGAGAPLGRWVGVPVRAHWSVLLAVGLFAFLLATVTLPAARPGASPAAYWTAGALTAVALLVTLAAHELAHAVAARHYELAVARITLWMLGGMTEIEGAFPSPRADAVVAAAGPLTSLGLGGMLAGTAWLVGSHGLVGYALVWLGVMNLVLGVFNLLPGAPLDGGRLLRALVWWRTQDRDRAAVWAGRVGHVIGAVLIGVGLVQVLAGDATGAWSALLGWFILSGAASEEYAVRAERLHGLTVRDVMSPTPYLAPSWWTVEQLVAALPPEPSRQPVVPLVDIDGDFVGAVTLATLDQVPVGRRAAVHLGHLAHGSDQLLRTGPDQDLAGLLLPLHLRGGYAVVLEGAKPVGFVSDGDVERAALTKRADASRTGGPQGADGAAPSTT